MSSDLKNLITLFSVFCISLTLSASQTAKSPFPSPALSERSSTPSYWSGFSISLPTLTWPAFLRPTWPTLQAPSRETTQNLFIAGLLAAGVYGGWRGWNYWKEKQKSKDSAASADPAVIPQQVGRRKPFIPLPTIRESSQEGSSQSLRVSPREQSPAFQPPPSNASLLAAMEKSMHHFITPAQAEAKVGTMVQFIPGGFQSTFDLIDNLSAKTPQERADMLNEMPDETLKGELLSLPYIEEPARRERRNQQLNASLSSDLTQKYHKLGKILFNNFQKQIEEIGEKDRKNLFQQYLKAKNELNKWFDEQSAPKTLKN